MADSTMWLMTEFFYQKELNKWEVINDLSSVLIKKVMKIYLGFLNLMKTQWEQDYRCHV